MENFNFQQLFHSQIHYFSHSSRANLFHSKMIFLLYFFANGQERIFMNKLYLLFSQLLFLKTVKIVIKFSPFCTPVLKKEFFFLKAFSSIKLIFQFWLWKNSRASTFLITLPLYNINIYSRKTTACAHENKKMTNCNKLSTIFFALIFASFPLQSHT